MEFQLFFRNPSMSTNITGIWLFLGVCFYVHFQESVLTKVFWANVTYEVLFIGMNCSVLLHGNFKTESLAANITRISESFMKRFLVLVQIEFAAVGFPADITNILFRFLLRLCSRDLKLSVRSLYLLLEFGV